MRTMLKRKNGFTLIELLVVIAIIALLAAILFPVFARARENARRASCQSNLKQIGIGIMQYTQDYDEMYPLQSHSIPGTVYKYWPDFTQPYIKSTQVFDCPSSSIKMQNLGGYWDNYAYGLNYWIASLPGADVKLSAINRPAETIMVAETGNRVSNNVSQGWPMVYSSHYGANNTADTTYGHNTTARARLSDRHFDGNNILWADGHVKWMRTNVLEADVGSGIGTDSKYWWGR